MANSQHKYLLERGWSQQQIDEVIRKAHEWLRGAGYTPLTEQGHWNGMVSSTQSYHLPSREKDARGMTEAFVEMLKGGKILDARRVHKFSRPGAPDTFAVEEGRVNVDGVEYRVLPYQLEYFKSDLAKFDDPKWRKQVVQQYLAKNYIKQFSRPGAPETFAVEDRFYFGKGRKERFASKEQALAFIKQYKRNEDSNAHSENVVLLAKFMGNSRAAKLASLVQQINEVAGHMPHGVGQFQYNELHAPLWKQFIAQYGDLYASVK